MQSNDTNTTTPAHVGSTAELNSVLSALDRAWPNGAPWHEQDGIAVTGLPRLLEECAHLCLRPACGDNCDQCSGALSPAMVKAYAKRYAYLRERSLDAIKSGGVFAGLTPDNVVLNGDDLDAAIDEALALLVNTKITG